MGVTAKVEDQIAFIGNERLLGNAKLTSEQQQTLHKLQAQRQNRFPSWLSG